MCDVRYFTAVRLLYFVRDRRQIEINLVGVRIMQETTEFRAESAPEVGSPMLLSVSRANIIVQCGIVQISPKTSFIFSSFIVLSTPSKRILNDLTQH